MLYSKFSSNLNAKLKKKETILVYQKKLKNIV